MPRRKGLGKGQGKGYKNILKVHDRRVHKDSGSGKKQPQRLNIRLAKARQGIKTRTVKKLPKSVRGRTIKTGSTKNFNVYQFGTKVYYVKKKKKENIKDGDKVQIENSTSNKKYKVVTVDEDKKFVTIEYSDGTQEDIDIRLIKI